MLKKLLPLALGATLAMPAMAQDYTKEEIGQIAAQYLMDNPEILVQVSEKLQEKQMQEQANAQINAVIENKDALLNDPKTPYVGNKDAKINVIEFFDYQCIYCYKISQTIEKIQAENSDIRFIFKETPIFGTRWEPSKYAAQMGLWVFAQGGSKAYETYHNGVYATGKNEGKLTTQDVDAIVMKANLNPKDFKADETYMQNLQLFAGLGFRGTPGLIVMPSTGADASNTFVINGADEAALLDAINKLK